MNTNGISFIFIALGIVMWVILGSYTTKFQMIFSSTERSCGVFQKYEIVDESRSGKIEVPITYIYIHGDDGDIFKFQYHGRLHKNMSYIKTDLKNGQRLCFEYIHPFFQGRFGNFFLKNIELNGE